MEFIFSNDRKFQPSQISITYTTISKVVFLFVRNINILFYAFSILPFCL